VPYRKPSAFPANQHRLAYGCVTDTICVLNNSTPTTQRGCIAAHNSKFLMCPCQNVSTSQSPIPYDTENSRGVMNKFRNILYCSVSCYADG